MSLSNMLQQLREFDTVLLANTIGYIDSVPAHELYMGGQVRSLLPSIDPNVGLAATCKIGSSTPLQQADMDPFYQQLEETSRTQEPVCWVVKVMGSRPDHKCVLGDAMAKLPHAVGCAGAVTDGGVCDVNGLPTMPFAMYVLYAIAHVFALRVNSTGKPVEIRAREIRPGDILHGDHEGIIRIPQSCLEQLPERAAQMRAFEHEAHCVFRQQKIPPARKRELAFAMLERYGFAHRWSAEAPCLGFGALLECYWVSTSTCSSPSTNPSIDRRAGGFIARLAA